MNITPELLNVIVAAIESYSESSEHTSQLWQLKPARIITSSDTAPTGIFDGDGVLGTTSTPVPLISLIGYCPAGARVMTLFVPPAGNYVIAPLTPFESTARLTSNVDLNQSDTALQAVSALTVTGYAGLTYKFKAMVFYQTETAADIQFALDFDGDASWAPAGFLPSGGAFESWFGATHRQPSLTANAVAGLGVGTPVGVELLGTIMPSVTGPITLYAAQNTADPSQTTILVDSWMEIKVTP